MPPMEVGGFRLPFSCCLNITVVVRPYEHHLPRKGSGCSALINGPVVVRLCRV